MTLPYERYRAMKCGHQFLLDLRDPKKTPKVPKYVRQRASSVLRHYPFEYHFELISEALPNEFEKTDPFLKKIQEVNNG
jgi:hypothetical protein